MNPPFSDEYIDSLYGQNYYDGTASYSYIDERRVKKYARYVWDKRIDTIHGYIPDGNFLDVGASFGGLMESAARFYTPYGIEISPYSGKEAAKLFAGNVHIGGFNGHPFRHDFFSVITMIELLEHLKEPLRAIEESCRLLKKGGVLVIQTANMGGLQAKIKKDSYGYFLPGHLSYFSKKNLTDALLRSGFSRVKAFIPVDFGLLPKLKKSRGNFNSIFDYRHWFRISAYHALGLLHFRDFCATSSMVLYAFK
ncbi:MAG: class I SAM-dependent methyltransferase [Leptospirales bacterium]|nr:class I SAM-dependent methyltransferase [Leptospirales bacterium]